MRPWGIFDGDVLAGRMVDREYDSWFAGAAVPTCGIAGVTVAAEFRGRGLLTPLFATVLEAARKRGAVISTLFPTAPRIYRKFGYETIGQFDTVEIPTATLGTVRGSGSATTRRAQPGDVDALREVYDAWASAQHGPLTRRGVSFGGSAEELVAAFTGATVAVDPDGSVRGYALWDRGTGYGEGARIRVADLVSTQPDATAALLRTLGSFASVAPATRIDTSGDDLVRYLLPTGQWRVVESRPYMLRLLDLPGAFAARTYPSHLDAELTFTVHDATIPDIGGTWRLSVSGGRGSCERATGTGPELGSRGLALVYAGTQGTANLRMAGLLRGDPRDDQVWDSLFGGRQVHVRDYF